MNVWGARLRDPKFPGNVSGGGMLGVPGTVELHFRLVDAGTHTGRAVQVAIAPDQLEIVARLVADGIAARDKAKAGPLPPIERMREAFADAKRARGRTQAEASESEFLQEQRRAEAAEYARVEARDRRVNPMGWS